ncbi:hypothetical protein F2Q69_00029634 [Brassica cretica]|uniref:Uncharacterized protein n=1 Tax=Brassica cretica TaxID=69181 RepID=A0A8S9RX10_BRACR|nr:hypothetical protein F2Q69_00029634 [Brassica cretica]
MYSSKLFSKITILLTALHQIVLQPQILILEIQPLVEHQLYSSSVNTLTHDTEGFLSYPLMSLYRQALQPQLQHDPRTLPRASLSL